MNEEGNQVIPDPEVGVLPASEVETPQVLELTAEEPKTKGPEAEKFVDLDILDFGLDNIKLFPFNVELFPA